MASAITGIAKCPKCGCCKSNVTESKNEPINQRFRREKTCTKCNHKWFTYEYGACKALQTLREMTRAEQSLRRFIKIFNINHGE